MRRRPASRLRRRPALVALLTSRPWQRAPLLAAGQPSAAFAVLVATAILGATSASGPLFQSSAGTAAVGRALGAECPEQGTPGVTTVDPDATTAISVNAPPAQAPAEDRAVREAFVRRGLPEPVRVMMVAPQAFERPLTIGMTGPAIPVSFFAHPDALENVTVLQRSGRTRGLWLPDVLAADLGIRAGDTVAVSSTRLAGDTTVTDRRSVPVAGIYRDLVGRTLGGVVPRFWCSWSGLIVPPLESDYYPFVITDDRTLLGLAGARVVAKSWYAAVDPTRLTVPEADELVARATGLAPELSVRAGSYGSYHPTGRLDHLVAQARETRAGLGGSIGPAWLAATLVGILLVGAAGGFWAERRTVEVRLLTARGVGPVGVGSKAALELLVPAVVGGAAGWLGGLALVGWLGPAREIEPGAAIGALRAVLLAVGAGMVLLAASAALRQRFAAERSVGLRRSRWGYVPWELACWPRPAGRTCGWTRTAGSGSSGRSWSWTRSSCCSRCYS